MLAPDATRVAASAGSRVVAGREVWVEKHHARILKQDPFTLFDLRSIRQRAKPGTLAVDNTDPVFLVISGDQRGLLARTQP
jgi:hypothetical protein